MRQLDKSTEGSGKPELSEDDDVRLDHTFDEANDTNTIESTPDSEPGQGEHSPLLPTEREDWTREYKKLLSQVEELRAWKESALTVEATWDAQAVGKLLGLTLGESIHANIQPKVEQLVNHAGKLAHALRQCAYGADTRKAIRQAREALAGWEGAQS